MHINYWNNDQYKNFEIFIEKNNKKIIDLDYIMGITNPNIIKNLINYFVEKTLKTIRLFK
jgi:hypothetical protein